MSETAESLAANQSSRRNVTIEIINNTANYCLIDPKIWLESGHCHSPPQPTVRPYKSEICNFTKSKGQAEGAVGLLTYEIFRRNSRCPNEVMTIMFSVPHNQKVYKNWFALSIHPKDVECNEKHYKTLYYDKNQDGFVRQEANGCILTFEGATLDLMGTMSNMGRAMMKVELWDKMFGPAMNQGPF